MGAATLDDRVFLARDALRQDRRKRLTQRRQVPPGDPAGEVHRLVVEARTHDRGERQGSLDIRSFEQPRHDADPPFPTEGRAHCGTDVHGHPVGDRVGEDAVEVR